MLTFVRTNELINATWDEFDLENATWEIPGWRMKMRNPHIVPLSRQVIELLREQKEETGHLNTNWVFPSQVRFKDPMSNNTILFAIGRMGYKGRMTGHGFRALAMSNIKEKLGFQSENFRNELVDSFYEQIKIYYPSLKGVLPEIRDERHFGFNKIDAPTKAMQLLSVIIVLGFFLRFVKIRVFLLYPALRSG